MGSVRGRFQVKTNLDRAWLLDATKRASLSRPAVNAVRGEASKQFKQAKGALTSVSVSQASLKKEQDQVANSLKLVPVKDFNLVNVRPGVRIPVMLVSAYHPASIRWNFGTRRTPATYFMGRKN